MFAVVKTGGKQYRVAVDDIIKVEKLTGEAGDKIQLADVLMVGDGKKTEVGSPFLSGKAVTAEILEQTRGEKILIFKKRRRQNSRRKNGHRQHLTVLKILGIGDGKAAPKKAAAKTDADDGKAAPKKAAAEKASAKKSDDKKAAPKKAAAKTEKKAAPKKAAAKKSPAKAATAKKASAAKSTKKES